MKKNWIWYALTLVLIACDQSSKWLAIHTLTLYQAHAVFPGLNWTLMLNSGAAFGFLSQSNVAWYPVLFTAFGLLMSVGLIVWMALCKAKQRLELLALSCILSGALGNVIDRMRFGHVIDFIQVYYGEHYFPVFNIADSTICVGAVLLFFASHEKAKRKKG
jgi:signal peptidase II